MKPIMSYQKKIAKLNQREYEVTQNKGTEPAFDNKYWDNKEEGLYIDIVSQEPLFSSRDKYDSGTGWPSFVRPLEQAEIICKKDYSNGLYRTEVASKTCHLGHVFDDGPSEFGGKRYCINSAALRFISKDELITQGFGDYMDLFTKQYLEKESALIAGGCFWGLEYEFMKIDGVISTRVGYTGGAIKNPSYEEICEGNTKHTETVEIIFKPDKIKYSQILKLFFMLHDPTSLNRQGNDHGTQYRSAIFYTNDIQKNIALHLKKRANASGVYKEPIVTEINDIEEFYHAEIYHQQYLKKNPGGYHCHFYRQEWNF